MKKRMRRCDPQKQAYWEEVLRRWQASGQTVRQFCRQAGLHESSLYFWRRELARRGQSSKTVRGQSSKTVRGQSSKTVRGQSSKTVGHPSKTASQSPLAAPQAKPGAGTPRRRLPSRPGAASFLPVRVVDYAAVEAPGALEIVLAHGRTVRVPAGFDRQTLADVLAVLEARPC